MAHTYKYPRPSVTVDCVVFGYEPAVGLQVLLIRRKDEPFKGQLALPGGFVNVSDSGGQGEDLEAAARRELREETGVQVAHLEQLYTFGAPGRDPRGRVISVAYLALVRSQDHDARAGSDASAAAWFSVYAIRGPLAFDHSDVMAMAVERLKAKIRYAPIGFNLLPPEFTLGELRALYEAILNRELDVSNFRKKALATGVLVATKKKREGDHRPAALYRFDRAAYDKAAVKGFIFDL
jgi:8-oxo-dGTP diphosphatase